MARLQGQNFRLGVLTGTTFKCYAMSTSCSLTFNTQTDDTSTKDDVGLSSKPTILSKSLQAQVESLDVLDASAILTQIKALQPFTIMWDETATSDNQTAQKAAFSMKCQVYLNDATFNFNDRENSAKSLQFTSTGAPEAVTGNITTTKVTSTAFTKGETVRLFLSSNGTDAATAVIAAAKQLSFHVSISLEDATTKDTDGDWQIQEPTGITFDISSNALVRSSDVVTSTVAGKDFASIIDIYKNGIPVNFAIANTSGANHRTKGTTIVSGKVIISQLQANSPNRQNVDYTTTLNGYGEYTVGA